jgi:hypothetical protein
LELIKKGILKKAEIKATIAPAITDAITNMEETLKSTYRAKYHLYPAQVLEIDIAKKVSSGKTREQAITELFEDKQKK